VGAFFSTAAGMKRSGVQDRGRTKPLRRRVIFCRGSELIPLFQGSIVGREN
jgi:hypothetical protein